jgi:tetratricopeptide (TPR) repeat protein
MSQVDHEDSLESEIRRCRERLAACPTNHPQRGDACYVLATLLDRSWTLTPSTALLDEVITMHREALALRPNGHPDHAMSCNSLGTALRQHYEVAGATPALDESIKLHHEAIALQPGGHPDRATSCDNLACALVDRYRVTGSSDLLDATITLHREALALRSGGHPDRSQSCNNLAVALSHRYRVTGSSDLLDEIIMLHREALALRPAGHPHRASSCNNLADALRDHYQATGTITLLEEVIQLQREALALRPAGHPKRANSRNNLAIALHVRYQVTGSSDLLNEVITLHREALALRPDGHPDRSSSCNNLAYALQERYRVTGSSYLIDEIITLLREALTLQPHGHPVRSFSCNNLAYALQERYRVTENSYLLDEIITLLREALTLQPYGHPTRASSCNGMADSLRQHFRKTKDVTVIDEALALARENAASAPPSELWRALLILFLVHMEQGSPHFSISTAIEYLLQASVSLPSTITEFMRQIQSCLDQMWLMHDTWTSDTTLSLFDVYSNIIDGLSRMTGFAFDTISQLNALRSARTFGSDACVTAILLGRPHQAIELIDRAHGVMWAQALHQRDPQLQDIPWSLASELEALFRAVSMPVTTHKLANSDPATRYLSPEDVRDRQNSRIQSILTEVRAMPGLERFMLGQTYAQIRETALTHPVVVLVSARGHVYALIIHDSAQEHPDMIHLRLASDRLSLLRDRAAGVGLRQGGQEEANVQDLEMDSERAIRMSRHKEASPLATLADLWHDVVKPVFGHLHLQVRLLGLHLLLLH